MKMYHFVSDEDQTEIIYSSTDESLIQECICDSFMEDLWYEVEDNLKWYGNTFTAMKDAWDSTLQYYNRYVYVGESRVI